MPVGKGVLLDLMKRESAPNRPAEDQTGAFGTQVSYCLKLVDPGMLIRRAGQYGVLEGHMGMSNIYFIFYIIYSLLRYKQSREALAMAKTKPSKQSNNPLHLVMGQTKTPHPSESKQT